MTSLEFAEGSFISAADASLRSIDSSLGIGQGQGVATADGATRRRVSFATDAAAATTAASSALGASASTTTSSTTGLRVGSGQSPQVFSGPLLHRHPAGSVAGASLTHFLALPAFAEISVLYSGHTKGQGFLEITKL
jgi:hypothetical protein